ncbi:hypothetical protein [Enterococcus sp. DIV0876]|uniref:hypothetical protein n=1 Tax=Enterococcus sp. DIV0876 TaxID=2774633 RepID=UPI003D2FEDAC
MTEYKDLRLTSNGQNISFAEVQHIAAKRAVHVLQEMSELGANLYLDNKKLDPNTIYTLSDLDLLQACSESKKQLGRQGILDLYADKLAKSRQMWHEIAEKSDDKNFKLSHVTVEVDGIDPELVAKQMVTSSSDELNIDIAYHLAPDHFVFDLIGNTQEVMETIGHYKEPTWFQLQLATEKQGPKKDPECLAAPKAQFVLDDGFRMPMYAMHQFYATPTGMRIELGLYFPSATPDEAVVGHREHFVLEFGNNMALALDRLHSAK